VTRSLRMGYGVPRSTWEIERPALRDLILLNPHPIVLIAGPAGCGKSVLVSQVCDAVSGTAVVWVDASRARGDGRSVAQMIRSTLCGDSTRKKDSALLPTPTEEDVVSAATAALCELGQPVLLVIDDLQLCGDIEPLLPFAASFRDSLPQGSRLVVTTRAYPLDSYPLSLHENLRLDAPSLKMTEAEIRQLIELVSGAVEPQAAQSIAELSGGHAALASVLARRAMLDHQPHSLVPEEDSTTLLVYLAREQLDSVQLALLYVASLLQMGHVHEAIVGTPGATCEDFREIERSIPLVRLDRDGFHSARFSVHGIAREAFCNPSFLECTVPNWRGLRENAIQLLEHSGAYARALRVLLEADTDGEVLAHLLESHGDDILGSGDATLLEEALAGIGPDAYVRRPRLLLLRARHLRETSDLREALSKVSVANDLARCDGHRGVEYESEILKARILIDLGRFADAAIALRAALDIEDIGVSCATRALTHAYLGICLAFTGESKGAVAHSEQAARVLASGGAAVEARARVALARAGIAGLVVGRWDEVLRDYESLVSAGQLPVGLRAEVHGNRAMVLAELGRLDRAEAAVEGILQDCRRHGLGMNERSILGTMSIVAGGLGEYRRAGEYAADAIRKAREAADRIEVTATLTYYCLTLRAQSEHQEALAAAEEALEFCGAAGQLGFLSWLAILETAASLLALGDVDAARTRSAKVREEAAAAEALYHVLRADLIIAEIEMREGRIEDAVARLRAHEEYILTESSNWQIAMYIRSFPSLLGILASAIDPDVLPAHLLQMVLPQDAEEVLCASCEVMEPDAWRRLAVRIVGESRAAQIAGEPTAPVCEVRLFGGLDVQVGKRRIIEKEWRKRKARLVFAMLVLRQGRDVPREQLMEYLWPEMEEPRARNNFYVVWSAMKGALSPEAGRNEPCPYVENSGGVCRVVRSLVRSDVDAFERTLQRARDADSAGDFAQAVRYYESLSEIYRGDLMPGDLYDDWFAAARDRYRNEFSDAMIRAADILQREGDPARALHLVRCALLFDPWREDLYQMALQCQIATGQRSAAIDTYMSCRSRLADDLGIDPSSETTRLYEHVLAMEELRSNQAAFYEDTSGQDQLA